MKRQLSSTTTPNLYTDAHGAFWARTRIGGRDRLRKLRATGLREAQRECRAWLAEIQKAAPVRTRGQRAASRVPTWQEAVGRWVKGIGERPDLARKTVIYYRERAPHVVALAEESPVDRITAEQVRTWWRGRCEATSPHHANIELSIVRRVFADLAEKGHVAADPSAGIRRLPIGQRRLVLPSAAQFAAILDAMQPGEARNMVRFMAYSGARISEARAIQWSDIDDGNPPTLTITSAKSRGGVARYRRIPANAALATLIEEMRAAWRAVGMEPTGPVFRMVSPRTSFENAQRAAGVSHMRIHDLRHLFATRCIEAGVDIPTVSRWLGHSDGGALAMRTYGHLRDDHSRAQMARVTF